MLKIQDKTVRSHSHGAVDLFHAACVQKADSVSSKSAGLASEGLRMAGEGGGKQDGGSDGIVAGGRPFEFMVYRL